MQKAEDKIRLLISKDQLEDACVVLESVDADLALLLQRELNQYSMQFVFGQILLDENTKYRNVIANRMLTYFKICQEIDHKTLTKALEPSVEYIEDSAAQQFLLPIEKILIKRQQDMSKTAPDLAPKIMTFYFLEQKERAITNTLSRLEAFQENGRKAITDLLNAFRESVAELQDLHSVLLASGFEGEDLTHTVKRSAELCDRLRKEISAASINNPKIRMDIEDAEIMLSRACRQIRIIKRVADRFSES